MPADAEAALVMACATAFAPFLAILIGDVADFSPAAALPAAFLPELPDGPAGLPFFPPPLIFRDLSGVEDGFVLDEAVALEVLPGAGGKLPSDFVTPPPAAGALAAM